MGSADKTFITFIGLIFIAGLIGAGVVGAISVAKDRTNQAKYEACLKAQALQVPFDLKCIEIIKEKA